MLTQNCHHSLAFRASPSPSLITLKLRATIPTGTQSRPSFRGINILTKAQQTPDQATTSSGATDSMDVIPPGCSRYELSITKPIGLVLEERKDTRSIVVAEIVPGGSADKTGLVNVGDILIATQGYTRTTEQVYGEIVVRGGEKMVRLNVRGEKFDTVMAAIGSIPGNMAVKLEFQRC